MNLVLRVNLEGHTTRFKSLAYLSASVQWCVVNRNSSCCVWMCWSCSCWCRWMTARSRQSSTSMPSWVNSTQSSHSWFAAVMCQTAATLHVRLVRWKKKSFWLLQCLYVFRAPRLHAILNEPLSNTSLCSLRHLGEDPLSLLLGQWAMFTLIYWLQGSLGRHEKPELMASAVNFAHCVSIYVL